MFNLHSFTSKKEQLSPNVWDCLCAFRAWLEGRDDTDYWPLQMQQLLNWTLFCFLKKCSVSSRGGVSVPLQVAPSTFRANPGMQEHCTFLSSMVSHLCWQPPFCLKHLGASGSISATRKSCKTRGSKTPEVKQIIYRKVSFWCNIKGSLTLDSPWQVLASVSRMYPGWQEHL